MESPFNDASAAALKGARTREWLIVASFVLISAYGFWAIWQPQESAEPDGVQSESAERGQTEGDDGAAKGAVLTPPSPPTGG